MRRQILFAFIMCLIVCPAAGAATVFHATMTGDQNVTPVVTDASGEATLTLNDTQNRLEIAITLRGLDLDGLRTPGDTLDDVVAMHIHYGAAGTIGTVLFGFIGPNSDTNGDLFIDPVAGTIHSAWDLAEGQDTTLAEHLSDLFTEQLYINVHTIGHSGGEIRGQILPEPGACVFFSVAGVWLIRRRS